MRGKWSSALAGLLLLFPSLAAADPFADFRIPNHRVFSWTGNLDASAWKDDTTFPGSHESNGSTSGSVSSSLFWLHDSDPHLLSLMLVGAADGSRSGQERTSPDFEGKQHRTGTNESWNLRATERWFPWRFPVGLQIQGNTIARYDQSWSNERTLQRSGSSATESRQSGRGLQYQYRFSGSGAVGVGRVRDATSAFDVMVFEDRMRRRGVLKGRLSPETRNRLAQLYYERNSYAPVLDRPGRTFWSAALEILREDPSFSQDLDAVSLLRALEPYLGPSGIVGFLPSSPVLRQRGFFVGLTAEASFIRSITRSSASSFIQSTVNDTVQSTITDESSSRSQLEDQDILAGPTLEWHRPLGLRWQADLTSTYLTPTRGPARHLRWTTNATLQWIIADRWLASAAVGHQRQNFYSSQFGGFPGDVWSVSYEADVAWYVEDHLRLGLSELGGQSHLPGFFRRRNQVFLSLGYRFAGRIDFPGLVEAVRVP